jgi:diguanylate cyclase (GGDEF)-like protein/PAS domain S-box-containing protein
VGEPRTGGHPGAPLPPDEVERLAALGRYAVLDTDAEQAFDDLCELAATVCDTPMAALSFVDADRQWFKARRGIVATETPRPDAFCAFTILGNDVLEVPDARDDPRFASNPLVTGEAGVRFYAAAPVRTPDGHPLGTVCVLDREPRRLSESQRAALAVLARQAMDELDLRLALAEQQAVQTRFESLVHKASDVMATIAADGTVLYATPNVSEVLGFDLEDLYGANAFKFVHAADLEVGLANLTMALERPGEPQTARVRVRTPDGGWRHLLATATSHIDDPAIGGVVLNVSDVTEQVEMTAALAASEARFRHLVHHSSDIIAIVDADGTIRYASPAVTRLLGHRVEDVLGKQVADLVDPSQRHLVETALRGVRSSEDDTEGVELRLRHADGHWLWFEVISTDLLDDPAVSGLVVNARDVTDRKQYEAQLLHEALHDPLTGLPNRALLEDRLEQALNRAQRLGAHVAVMFLDIDHFKLVNDSSGHAIGDLLLVETARRLEAATRASDSVVRFGGDEFVVLCEDTTVEEARALAQRIRARLSQPVAIDGQSFFLDVSVGIAQARPTDDAGSLLQAADTAMYVAKEQGRGRVEVFAPELREVASARAALLADLHLAVETGELEVEYQPIVRLQDGACMGVEALMRWHHPVHGAIPPEQFVPMAEESGLIVEMGRAVVADAISNAVRWAGTNPGLYVSVNVSARQLREPSFVRDAYRMVEEVGLDASSLVLELTETILMQEGAATRDNLDAARATGLRVAVDDFGTGYSSLAYLKLIAVAVLKIDGSFVSGVGADPYDSSIVAAISTLGETLGLSVVAEHVETEAQREALLRLGCRLGQGFLFSPAMPADRIDALLASGAGGSPRGDQAK